MNIDWSRARKFATSQPRQVRWLVEEIIPADTVTLISSVSGAGKSMLLLNLAICVISGQPWLGVKTLRGGVAYWDQDNPDTMLTENRIVAIAKGLDVDLTTAAEAIIFRASGQIIGNLTEINDLRQRLTDMGISVLIVDTLAAINPWDEQGVALSKVVTDGLFPLVEAGITPILLHHIGKAQIDAKGNRHPRSGVDAARGHSSLIGSAGAAFNLLRVGNDRILECVKPRYGEVRKIKLAYDEDSALGLPDWKVTIKCDGIRLSQEKLAQLIRDHNWSSLSSRQIVEKAALLGFETSQRTASRALSQPNTFPL